MTKTEREHYWREHVEAALSHPKSLRAYCSEAELCYQSLLNWKRRLGAARFIELQRPTSAREEQTLLVQLGDLRLALAAGCPPNWAGEFVAALHAELSTGREEARR